MMRTTLFGAALLAFAVGMPVSAAAQLTPYAGPARPAVSYWQGPYVGLNLGYQLGSTTNNPTEPSGVAGGIQAGYNMQRGQFVVGAETDLQLSGADDRFAPWKFSNPWFGTLRGRAGLAMNSILVYGTLGLAYGTLKAQSTITGISESKGHLGWTAGAGLEVGLPGNWSARAEYLYIDLSDRTYMATGTSNGLQSSLLRFGVNYRF